MRGLASDDDSVGSGPVGLPMDAGFNWDSDQSYGDWYGGHEIGHLHGRNHPGFVPNMAGACIVGVQDSSTVDTNFPNANGSIGNPGWDAGDASLSIPAQILPPYTATNINTWTDMMTYCNFEWISDYTYESILDRIDSSALTALAAAPAQIVDDALIVAGTINLTRNSVDLAPFMRLADVPMDPRPTEGSFAIDLLGDGGPVLAHYPFTPEPGSDIPVGEDITALLSEVVPFDPATRRIVITSGGVELASRTVSPHPPAVQLLSPNGGEILDDATAVVTWQGSDPDGDPLRYTLLYSIDAGTNWFPLAVDVAGTTAVVNLDDVPGSVRARLRVIATDGVNTAIDDSDGVFEVPRKAPEVRIIAPPPETPLTTRQTVVFAGEAFDREDGDVDGDALHWSSDRQGAFGSGRSVAITGLAPGRHVVTLAATDSDGQSATAQLVIDVAADLPQAVIAAPRIVLRGSEVELDAGGSYGVGGLTYRWAVTARPAGSDARLLANDGAATALVTDDLGAYEVELVVRDALGNVSIVHTAISAVSRSACIAATIGELFDGDAVTSTDGGCDANADGVITAADLPAALER